MQSMKSVSPDVYEKTEGQTDKQTNKQTNKPTKQKDYTSPALAGAGDYNEVTHIARKPKMPIILLLIRGRLQCSYLS